MPQPLTVVLDVEAHSVLTFEAVFMILESALLVCGTYFSGETCLRKKLLL